MMGVIEFFTLLPVTYIFYALQPTDPANFVFFTAGLWLIEKRQFTALCVLLPISILNRETTLLLVPAWLALEIQRGGLRRSIWTTAVLTALTMSSYLGLRLVFGLRETYTDLSYPWVAIPLNLSNQWVYFLMALFLGWQLIVCLLNWRNLGLQLRILIAVLVPLFFGVHLALASIAEIRYWLPLLPLLLAATLPWFVGDECSKELHNMTC
jgi:hypothetical protein